MTIDPFQTVTLTKMFTLIKLCLHTSQYESTNKFRQGWFGIKFWVGLKEKHLESDMFVFHRDQEIIVVMYS